MHTIVHAVMNFALHKIRGFVDYLRNAQLFKKQFAPWTLIHHRGRKVMADTVTQYKSADIALAKVKILFT